MTIKLKNNLVNYEEKRTAFVNAVKNEETQEIQNKAYVEMVDAMAADIMDQAKKKHVKRQTSIFQLAEQTKISRMKKLNSSMILIKKLVTKKKHCYHKQSWMKFLKI